MSALFLNRRKLRIVAIYVSEVRIFILSFISLMMESAKEKKDDCGRQFGVVLFISGEEPGDMIFLISSSKSACLSARRSILSERAEIVSFKSFMIER